MAKTRGAAAAAAGTVVHNDPESGKEAVSPVETPGAARAMQTRTATRKSSRRRTPVATGMDNNGEEGEKGDTPPAEKRRRGKRDKADAAGLRARVAEGGSEAAALLPEFPAERPKRRTLRCLQESEYEKGLDSDGEYPFYYDYTDDEEDDVWGDEELEEGKEEEAEEGGEEGEEEEDGEPPPLDSPLEVDEIKTWKGKRLREELKARGLSQCGAVPLLITRLCENREAPLATKGTKGTKTKKKRKDNHMGSLPPGASWRLLTPLANAVAEPSNVDPSLKPPTNLDGPVNPKYSYSDKFERAPFTGTDAKLPRKEDKQDASNVTTKKQGPKRLSPTRKGKPTRIPEPRTKGGPNMDHINRYMLDLFSEPLDWFRSIMPLYESDNLEPLEEIDAIGDGRTKFCVANWCAYTNVKAMMAGAGIKGGEYEGDWVPFTYVNFFQQLGLLTLDGVSPKMQMQRRVRPQAAERTDGNDLLASCLGQNAYRRWCMFKKYFGMQDPTSIPPERKKCPNFKCDSTFRWLHHQGGVGRLEDVRRRRANLPHARRQRV